MSIEFLGFSKSMPEIEIFRFLGECRNVGGEAKNLKACVLEFQDLFPQFFETLLGWSVILFVRHNRST